ncbi:MAG: hypothetical protein IT236_03150, partial [Bacteroidia bacterium]|nr:hypothetical protein [Bacteroidia bacterium]
MKKYKFIVLFFAGISVLFVLFNFLIFSSFISINKSNFREEAIRKHNSGLIQLPMAKLQLYKNAPGIEWKDENKELVIMGQYYEVLSITTTKSGVLVTLIADTEESGLFKKYFSYAKKQH